jgi:hypothetical protein
VKLASAAFSLDIKSLEGFLSSAHKRCRFYLRAELLGNVIWDRAGYGKRFCEKISRWVDLDLRTLSGLEFIEGSLVLLNHIKLKSLILHIELARSSGQVLRSLLRVTASGTLRINAA